MATFLQNTHVVRIYKALYKYNYLIFRCYLQIIHDCFERRRVFGFQKEFGFLLPFGGIKTSAFAVTNTALSAEPLLFDREAKSVKQYITRRRKDEGGEWSKPSSLF